MIYYSSKEPFAFRIFKTRSFGDDIYSGKITINEANQEQDDLVEYILILIIKPDQKVRMIKKIKKMFLILQKTFMKEEN